jgi:hypothetical protein
MSTWLLSARTAIAIWSSRYTSEDPPLTVDEALNLTDYFQFPYGRDLRLEARLCDLLERSGYRFN